MLQKRNSRKCRLAGRCRYIQCLAMAEAILLPQVVVLKLIHRGIPAPNQSGVTASTPENYWKGGLSARAVECSKKEVIW
ncbi:MAG: hypothetical protein IPL08_15065 [Saprospiraceae bacterium]|nr:hypothetical protein [Saprospiraceae bacterium]